MCTFWSQAQNGITYQAVILNPNTEELPGADNSRLPLVNQDITLEFKILNASSSLDYQEIINTQTDEFGMVNVVIGTGTRKAGIATQFSTINWDGSAKNLIVSLDPSGQSTHFIEISNQPFTYVPFALYAAHTGVTGTQGPAGNNGLDGKTVLNGTTIPNASIGTNGDFYINTATSNLFGPKTNDVWGNGVPLVGPQGIQGIAGPTGSTGPQGIAGINGSNGQDGLSAYQIWLNAGNTGTESQFLTALQGATGAQGPQGVAGIAGPAGNTGPQGITGTNGANGLDGKTILNGNQDPTNSTGNNGDFYINTTTNTLFGPKTSGAWGSGIAVVGPQGAAGTNGKNTLVNTTTEAAGANCANGGTKIEVGLDTNNNGNLDLSEISNVSYICNSLSNINNGNIDNQLSNVFLLNNTSIYTVPVGKSARISNILANASWFNNMDKIISINGNNVYIGTTNKRTVNQNDDIIMWTSFLVEGDFWFPSGTTINITSVENIGFLSIQEIDNTNLKCHLITTSTTVPIGKKWKLSSVLPSQNFIGRKEFIIKINGNSIYVGNSEDFYNANAWGAMTFDLMKGNIWLPEGTVIEPSTNLYGISVIEY